MLDIKYNAGALTVKGSIDYTFGVDSVEGAKEHFLKHMGEMFDETIWNKFTTNEIGNIGGWIICNEDKNASDIHNMQLCK